MPRLLYRMMLVDLLRVVGLTAGVLVTVIAFGATVKPLTSDSLLSASQTLKYLLLAIVPMLQFALPFAAGFGATIAMHRMAADNEVQAMAVSGLSYRAIIAPIAGLGLVLLVVMVILTQEIIPRFWSMIEQMIASDVTKVFQASIRRGEPFKLGDMQIYADEMILEYAPEGPQGPDTRMKLLKVAAAELDGDGRVVTDVTANRAIVDIYRRDGATIIKLKMFDTVAYNSITGDLMRHAEIAPSRAMIVPGIMRDNPKAMSRGALLRLRENPDDFAQVIEARQNLADTLRETEARQQIDAQLRAPGQSVELLAPPIPGESAALRRRTYTVHAAGFAQGQFTTRGGARVRVVQADNGVPIREFSAESASLTASPGVNLGLPTFDLSLGRHEVRDLRTSGGANVREGMSFPGLTVSGVSREDLLELPSSELLERATRFRAEGVRFRTMRLAEEIDSLHREISSRLLNRYALSVTAPLLLLLGSLLAMWLRGSLPLTIYLLAFLPSVLDLIAISAGEQLMRDGRVIGPLVMWSGNAFMLAMVGLAYARLARH